MKVLICQCDDCGWCEYYRFNAGPPKSCGECGGPIIFEEANIDPDSIGEELLGKVARRPAWYPGRQKQVRERAMSIGGTIYCALCELPIVVNADGKEEWHDQRHIDDQSLKLFYFEFFLPKPLRAQNH